MTKEDEKLRSVGRQFQTTGPWQLKDLYPKDFSFQLGTLRNLSLLDLSDQDG